MADININPFGEHESRPEEPTDEHIPLDPHSGAPGPLVTPGGRWALQAWGCTVTPSTWEPTLEPGE